MGEEFRINKYITIKLENKETNIYIGDKLFIHCTYLLTNPKKSDIKDLYTVDEISSKLGHQLSEQSLHIIKPEEKFWGVCSNTQAWAENDYNPELMNSKISFSLLEHLTYAGDKKAKRVFNNEIKKRLVNVSNKDVKEIIKKGYENYLRGEFVNSIESQLSERLIFDRIFVSSHIKNKKNISELPEMNLPLAVHLDLGEFYHLKKLPDIKADNLQTIVLPYDKIENLESLTKLENLNKIIFNNKYTPDNPSLNKIKEKGIRVIY